MKLATGCLCLAAFLPYLPAQDTRYRDRVFDDVTVTKDIVYGSAYNRYLRSQWTLALDLYEPRGDTAARRPAVVIVHGGSFFSGDKAEPAMRRLGEDFAKRGFVAVSINYRLWPRTPPFTRQIVTDAAHDMKAAVRWLRRNASRYRADPTRIGCIGSSAGGVTCAEATYVPGEGISGNPGFSSALHAAVVLWGGMYDVRDLEAGEPPVQIFHGTRDRAVPFRRAQELKSRADEVGVPSDLEPIVGAGHEPWDEYFRRHHPSAAAFFYQVLGLAQLSGLAAEAGFRSPGRIELRTSGNSGDEWVLVASAGPAAVSWGAIGTLRVDPRQVVAVRSGRLASTGWIVDDEVRLRVPPGLRGRTLYWQALHVAPEGFARALTNAVATRF